MNKLYSLITLLVVACSSVAFSKPESTQSLYDLQRKVNLLTDKALAHVAVKDDRAEVIKALEILKQEKKSLQDVEQALDTLAVMLDKKRDELNIRSAQALVIAENGSEHFFDVVTVNQHNNKFEIETKAIPSFYGKYKKINVGLSELKNRGFDLTIDQKIGFVAYALQQLKENQKLNSKLLENVSYRTYAKNKALAAGKKVGQVLFVPVVGSLTMGTIMSSGIVAIALTQQKLLPALGLK